MKTKDLIIDEFIKSFGISGYEGTSIDFLAKQVGIKKGSLYTHFSGKQEIFIAAANKILTKVNQKLFYVVNNNNQSPEQILFSLLATICIENDYLTSDEIAFVRRTTLLSDSILLQSIEGQTYEFEKYIDGIVENLFIKCIDNNLISPDVKEHAKEAYLLLFNNLYISFKVNNKEITEKIGFLWNFYWKGVSS